MSDEVLWSSVLAGETRHYGAIWDRHRDRIYWNLVRSGAESHNVEDLTAVVFLELWRKRESLRFIDGSLLPWLVVTAQNVLRNDVRAKRRYRRFLDALPAPEVVPDPAILAAEADSERNRTVRDIMSAARPDDSRLLAMTALEGFTTREAAAILGLSESAAKMRLSRLRAKILGALDSITAPEGGQA